LGIQNTTPSFSQLAVYFLIAELHYYRLMDEQNKSSILAIPQIILEGKNIYDIPSFYREINQVFMQNEDWELGESLDAFNDLLFGGFGLLKDLPHIQLIWNNADLSSQALDYDTTKVYYLKKIEPGSPYNRIHFEQKLSELEAGNGQTYFQIILEIISDHPNIHLVKK
jgi:RNAse (barnase) inhibitor barstar